MKICFATRALLCCILCVRVLHSTFLRRILAMLLSYPPALGILLLAATAILIVVTASRFRLEMLRSGRSRVFSGPTPLTSADRNQMGVSEMTEKRLLPDGLAVAVRTGRGRMYAARDRRGNVVLEINGEDTTLPRQSARQLAEGIVLLVGASEDDYTTSRKGEAERDGAGNGSPEEYETERGNQKSRRSDDTTLSDLVAAGLLPSGSLLQSNLNGVIYDAIITEDGHIELDDGTSHLTPSGAFKAATGRIGNGWDKWETSDGATIGSLRGHLKAEQQTAEAASVPSGTAV